MDASSAAQPLLHQIPAAAAAASMRQQQPLSASANSNGFASGLPSQTLDSSSSLLPAAAVPAQQQVGSEAQTQHHQGEGGDTVEAFIRQRRRYNHESFPQKLHRLLTDATVNGQEDVVRFTHHGTRWEIVDTTRFQALLPRYFRHGKISSFRRLLAMYDFKRLTGTWNQGTFEHPYFRQDKPELLKHVVRVVTLGKDKKNGNNKDG